MSQEDNLYKNDENFNFEAKIHVLYENKRFKKMLYTVT